MYRILSTKSNLLTNNVYRKLMGVKCGSSMPFLLAMNNMDYFIVTLRKAVYNFRRELQRIS